MLLSRGICDYNINLDVSVVPPLQKRVIKEIGRKKMKKLITTKVETGIHKKVVGYSLQAGLKRSKRMSLYEAYGIVIEAGLKVLKKTSKK